MRKIFFFFSPVLFFQTTLISFSCEGSGKEKAPEETTHSGGIPVKPISSLGDPLTSRNSAKEKILIHGQNSKNAFLKDGGYN